MRIEVSEELRDMITTSTSRWLWSSSFASRFSFSNARINAKPAPSFRISFSFLELMLAVRVQALRTKNRFFRFQVEQRARRDADHQQIVERDGHEAVCSCGQESVVVVIRVRVALNDAPKIELIISIAIKIPRCPCWTTDRRVIGADTISTHELCIDLYCISTQRGTQLTVAELRACITSHRFFFPIYMGDNSLNHP